MVYSATTAYTNDIPISKKERICLYLPRHCVTQIFVYEIAVRAACYVNYDRQLQVFKFFKKLSRQSFVVLELRNHVSLNCN